MQIDMHRVKGGLRPRLLPTGHVQLAPGTNVEFRDAVLFAEELLKILNPTVKKVAGRELAVPVGFTGELTYLDEYGHP